MARVKSRTGNLRHKLEWFQPAYSADAAGQEEPSWTSRGHTWAELEPLGAGESPAEATTHAIGRYLVTCRWDPRLAEMDETWRFAYDGRVFNVASAFTGGEWTQWIQVEAREVKS